MAKKDFGEAIEKVSPEQCNTNAAINFLLAALKNSELQISGSDEAIKQLKIACAQLGLSEMNAKTINKAVEQLRTALANLGLKIIEDIHSRRVQKPEEIYNALVSIYNAIK